MSQRYRAKTAVERMDEAERIGKTIKWLEGRTRRGVWIVRWKGFPVRFDRVPGKVVYSLVREEEATRFETFLQGFRKANENNLKASDFEVVGVDNRE